jgi:hypothetical protein
MQELVSKECGTRRLLSHSQGLQDMPGVNKEPTCLATGTLPISHVFSLVSCIGRARLAPWIYYYVSCCYLCILPLTLIIYIHAP